MKRLAISLSVAALAFFGAAPEASARHHHGGGGGRYVSSYQRCGCPVYAQRYIAFYDHWGRPVWRVRYIPAAHRCGWGRPVPPPYPGYYRGGYSGYGYRSGGVIIRGSW